MAFSAQTPPVSKVDVYYQDTSRGGGQTLARDQLRLQPTCTTATKAQASGLTGCRETRRLSSSLEPGFAGDMGWAVLSCTAEHRRNRGVARTWRRLVSGTGRPGRGKQVATEVLVGVDLLHRRRREVQAASPVDLSCGKCSQSRRGFCDPSRCFRFRVGVKEIVSSLKI